MERSSLFRRCLYRYRSLDLLRRTTVSRGLYFVLATPCCRGKGSIFNFFVALQNSADTVRIGTPSVVTRVHTVELSRGWIGQMSGLSRARICACLTFLVS